METKYKILLVTGLCFASFAGGYYALPAKVKIVEKIVEKKVIVKDTDIKTVIVERPDGTKTTVIDEHSTAREESETKTDKTTTKERSSKHTWLASAQVGVSASHLSINPELFQASVSRRILGPVYLGVYTNSDFAFGLSITIGF